MRWTSGFQVDNLKTLSAKQTSGWLNFLYARGKLCPSTRSLRGSNEWIELHNNESYRVRDRELDNTLVSLFKPADINKHEVAATSSICWNTFKINNISINVESYI